MGERYSELEYKSNNTKLFRQFESPLTFQTSGKYLDLDFWYNNNKDDDTEQYILPITRKSQKEYRKYDQKGIRKIKTIALECLKHMNMKHLYNYWSKNKKDEGERNKRYIILLFVFLIANEQNSLVEVFMQKYKYLCSEIINKKNQQAKKQVNPTYLKSIKYHLTLSIKAAEAFVNSSFDIDEGLKIMQNLAQTEYYENSKSKLNSYMTLIKQNRHKNFNVKEINMPKKN